MGESPAASEYITPSISKRNSSVPTKISPAVIVGTMAISLVVAMVPLTAVQVLEAKAKGVLEPVGVFPEEFSGLLYEQSYMGVFN